MSPQGASLKPSDMVAGGGQFDDIDVQIIGARFRGWDYNGTISSPILGFEVTYRASEDAHEFSQVYSAGDLKHFAPSEDGRYAVPVGNQAGLSESTNLAQWMTALINAGFPESKIGEDVTAFVGTVGHVNNVPQMKRAGLATAKDGKVLIFTKIHSFPWDAAAQTAKAAAPAAKAKAKGQPQAAAQAAPVQAPVQTAAAPAGSDDGALSAQAVQTVLSILTEKGGTISKTAITQEAFKKLMKDPDRNKLLQLIFKDEFLKGQVVEGGVPWAFDGTTISLGG
jgi:hypothetical protein